MTIKIDRMALDDAGGDPERIAAAVIAQIRDLAPPIPVEEIAYAADITEIQRTELTNYEGGLIAWDDKFEGKILVNCRSIPERQRYTIGHELGHFLNPWHQPPSEEGFRCTATDMVRTEARPGDRALQMEVEANIFAAELLLPRTLFLRDLRTRAGLDLEHIVQLAGRYAVSKEATGRRYVALQNEPCAIVFSRNGLIRYSGRNQEFPFLDIQPGQPVPAQSLAARRDGLQGVVSDWSDVDGGIWLSQPRGRRVCEQTLAQREGYRVTLLALADEELDEDCDEERELVESWGLQLRR
jgi:Zn-dependent peptidase ImmA (M78 family)